MQKYKCDFCKKRGVRWSIEKHEKICFRNPNRFCPDCENTGMVTVCYDGGCGEQPCHYCSKFDKEMLRQIEEREEKERNHTPVEEPEINIPF